MHGTFYIILLVLTRLKVMHSQEIESIQISTIEDMVALQNYGR